MPNDERSVIDEVSGASKEDHSTPAGEGKSRVSDDLEKKVREQVKAEYERKLTEAQETKSKYEAMLTELQSKPHKTDADRRDIQSLQRNIERRAQEIESDENYPSWEIVISRVVTNMLRQYDKIRADDYLLDRSEGEEDRDSFEKFVKGQLSEGRWMDKRESLRVRTAVGEWKKEQSRQKKLKAAEEKDKSSQQFQEQSTNRIPRKTNYGQELSDARKAGDPERLRQLAGKRLTEIFDGKK